MKKIYINIFFLVGLRHGEMVHAPYSLLVLLTLRGDHNQILLCLYLFFLMIDDRYYDAVLKRILA